jgi:hypothetical protein
MRSYLDILTELRETLDSDNIPEKDKKKIDNLLQKLFEVLYKYSY